MRVRIWPFVALMLGVLLAAEASKIAVVVPLGGGAETSPNPLLPFQIKASVEQAASEIFSAGLLSTSKIASPIEIELIVLSGQPSADLARVLVSASDPACVLAVIASREQIFIASYTDRNIPVILLGKEASDVTYKPLGLQMSPLRAAPIMAAADLFGSLSWSSINLFTTPSFGNDENEFEAMLQERNIQVSYSVQINPHGNPAEIPTPVMLGLEKSASRVIVALASAADFAALVARANSARYEFVWIEPGSSYSHFLNLNNAAFYSRVTDTTPLGILATGFEHNLTRLESFKNEVISINSTAFANGLFDTAADAHDAILIWALAANSAQNATNGTEVSELMRSNFSSPYLLSSPAVFRGDGQRVGHVSILNLRYHAASASNGTWDDVGDWIGSTSVVAGSSLLDLRLNNIVFADGSNQLPSYQQLPSISLGLVWWDSTNPTWKFLYGAWRNVTQWAIDSVNTNTTRLGGRRLKLLLGDNQDSASQTIIAGVELIERGVVGFLGPARSAHSIALQYYAGGRSIPHISFASTSDTLSDKRNYPTFFRTIIPDSYQAKALAGIMKYYNWKSCCILNYDDDYSNGVTNSFIAEGNKFDMKVLAKSTFLTTRTDFNETFSLIRSSGCRVIVSIIDFDLLPLIIRGARQEGLFGEGSGYNWLFPEAAAADMYKARLEYHGLNPDDFNGVIVTNPLDGPANSPLYKDFVDLVRAKTGAAPILYQTFLWDAVWVYARAIEVLLAEGKDPAVDKARFLEIIRTTKFEGVSGTVGFDALQDRSGASYGVFNYRKDQGALVLVGLWEPSGLNLTKNTIFSDGTENIPSDLLITSLTFANGGSIAITVVVSLVLALVAVVTGIIVCVYKENRLIRRSSPTFLLLIVFGLTLAAISVYFWYDTPTSALCHLRIWFAFIGCALAYSALLTKNWHLWYLFNEPSLRVITVSMQKLFTIAGVVVAPVAVLLILWSSIDPFQIVQQENSAKTMRYLTCQSKHDVVFASIEFAYMGFLFIAGAVLSFKTRTLPDTFRESQWIALATYNLLFVSAVGILVGYILSFEPAAYPFIVAVCIIFAVLVTWALIFLPKFWLIFVHPELITDSFSMTGKGNIQMGLGSPQSSRLNNSRAPGATRSATSTQELAVSKGKGGDGAKSDNSDSDSDSDSDTSEEAPAKKTANAKAPTKKPRSPKSKIKPKPKANLVEPSVESNHSAGSAASSATHSSSSSSS